MRTHVTAGWILAALCSGAVAGEINWNGDFRYRIENVDSGGSTYLRERIRMRIGGVMDVNEDMKIGARFASGPASPGSTNQTLQDSFTTKSFMLDLAYLDWTLASMPDTKTMLTLGKMKLPFVKPNKTTLVWDGDITPEGIALKYTLNGFYATAGWFVLDSDGKMKDDEDYPSLASLQIGINQGGFGAGIAYHGYANLKGATTLVDPESGEGNTTTTVVDYVDVGPDGIDDGGGNDDITVSHEIYDNDYTLVDMYVQYTVNVADAPLVVWADYITNTAADDNNTGFAAGATWGKAAVGKVSIGIEYRSLEADAAIGALVDGDFIGGGTNGDGLIVKLGTGLGDKAKIGLSYYNNTQDPDGTADSYSKVQLDIVAKF